MIYVEIIMSVLTLLSIWLVTNQYLMLGLPLGIITQFSWVALWIYTGQYGIIIIDIGILAVYSERMHKFIKGE